MPDDDIRARAEGDIAANLRRPDRRPEESLALAARILAADGHASGLAGQVTARAEAGG